MRAGHPPDIVPVNALNGGAATTARLLEFHGLPA